MFWFNSNKVDTPTTLQMEAVECGAASLCMILEYYGNYVPLETLRIECGVSRDGSKASNILKAARRYEMEAKGYRKEPKELLTMKLPFVVFWDFAHFLVVEGFGKKGEVYINDPAGGKKVLSWEDFDKGFTGVVLTFKPTDKFNGNNKRPSMFPGLFRRLKTNLPQLSIAVIAGILMTIPGLMIPIFSKVFIDDYLIKGMHDWVMPLILIMIATALVNAALNFFQQYYLLKMENSIAIKESSKLFWHIVKLPMDFFNQRFAGEIGNRISLNNRVASIISGQFAVNIIGVFSIVMYAILMFYYDAVLTIISIFFILLNIFVFRKIIEKAAIKNQRLSIEKGKLLGVSMSGLQSIETIKAGASENDFFQKWAGHQAKMQNATNEMSYLNQASTLLPTLFTTLNITIVLILGSIRVIDGHMTMGMLVAFQALMQSLSTPINNLLALSTTIKNLEGDMNYLDDVFKYPLDKEKKESNEKLSSAKLKGKIELKNIAFGYSKLEEPLIKDFNLEIEPGKRVAFVGFSGSGKSTIAKVLTSLYKPWEGEILFDDKNIDDISLNLITNSISMVDQEISLFRGTIKENVTLWNEKYTDQEVIQACKDACIHDIIAALPNAYNTVIEENGRNFSGGQKQRLEIARAFLSTPSILILDEATSALDPITEMKIDENIRRRGCTSIIIAHRLSTIRDADLIVVLKNGLVVQKGVHNELKNEDGLYAQLIKG